MSEEIKTTAQQEFDKDKEYTEEVIPVLEKLVEVCDKHGIPFFVHCVFKCKQDGKSCHVGRGVIMHNQGLTGFDEVRRMSILGNVSNGNFSFGDVARAYLTREVIEKVFGKGDSE